MPTESPRAAIIKPTAVYSLEQARSVLGLAKCCLPREIRLGRLRVAKRAGKYLILGKWLLGWIEAGEIVRKRTALPEAQDRPNLGRGPKAVAVLAHVSHDQGSEEKAATDPGGIV